MQQMLAVQTNKIAGFLFGINGLWRVLGAVYLRQIRRIDAFRINHLARASKRVALVACAALTACGGGGSSSPSAEPACRPFVTVRLFGDSTMVGVNIEGGAAPLVPKPPAVLLQAEMDAKFGAAKVVVLDHAGGFTAKSAIEGTDNYKTPLAQIPPADVSVFNHGINDFSAYSLEAYRGYLEVFAKHGGAVIFYTQAVRFMPDHIQAMKDVAAKHGQSVADLNSYALALPSLAPYLLDGTHGTQAWYTMTVRDVLAPAVALKVAPLLCK
jgi:hypothetical protein